MYDRSGKVLEEIEVSELVFGVDGPESLVHAAVVRHLANGRQGTADTKTRGEVAGGGRKPWRQKGTGRARHGSIRSPIWRGGGVTFGPHPRDFSLGMPRQARRQALLIALSGKARAGGVVVVDELAMAEPKTKALAEMLRSFGEDAVSTLIVTAAPNANVALSVRNLPGVRAIEARNVNVYDVVKHDRVLFTRDALARLEEVLAS
jgi:large subunit ribosomal protein L4